ncbi:MAG: alkaline phosphatase family protein, partial [Mobilitalea sp.]
VGNSSLPHLSKVYNSGVRANFISTHPPLTPPAWTSAFTGVNPGKHNIFDFIYYDGYDAKVVSSTHRKSKAIWDIMGDYSKKSIVVNVPCSFPPTKINGIMVSGMGTPSVNSNFVYPDQFKKDIINDGYIIEYGSVREWAIDQQNYFSKIQQMCYYRKELVEKLIKRNDWDLFVTVFTSLDRVQHIFWRTDENETILAEDYNVLTQTYKIIDEMCSSVLNNLPEGTHIFIVSDHGFGPLKHGVFINNYLREQGFINFTSDNSRSFYNLFNQSNLVNVAEKVRQCGLGKLLDLIPLTARSNIFHKTGMGLIDWNRTVAWFGTTSGHAIHINLAGRQPNGLVAAEDYGKICDEIIEKMYLLRDPSNGKKVIKKCYKREDIYKGPYLRNAPDILIEPIEGYCLQEGFGNKLIDCAKEGSLQRFGDHLKEGVFMCCGPEIKEGYTAEDIDICDLTPTILHLMDLPLPKSIDGRVVKDIFKPNSGCLSRETRYVDTSAKERTKELISNLKRQGKIVNK